MSTSTAQEYAQQFAEQVWERAREGAPFGLVNNETEEWTDDAEAYVSFLDDENTTYREASASDYLNDVLDFQYIVNADRTYRAGRVLVGFGGPNVWIDTLAGVVEVTWWSGPVTRSLPASFVDGLDEALSELWDEGA